MTGLFQILVLCHHPSSPAETIDFPQFDSIHCCQLALEFSAHYIFATSQGGSFALVLGCNYERSVKGAFLGMFLWGG